MKEQIVAEHSYLISYLAWIVIYCHISTEINKNEITFLRGDRGLKCNFGADFVICFTKVFFRGT